MKIRKQTLKRMKRTQNGGRIIPEKFKRSIRRIKKSLSRNITPTRYLKEVKKKAKKLLESHDYEGKKEEFIDRYGKTFANDVFKTIENGHIENEHIENGHIENGHNENGYNENKRIEQFKEQIIISKDKNKTFRTLVLGLTTDGINKKEFLKKLEANIGNSLLQDIKKTQNSIGVIRDFNNKYGKEIMDNILTVLNLDEKRIIEDILKDFTNSLKVGYEQIDVYTDFEKKYGKELMTEVYALYAEQMAKLTLNDYKDNNFDSNKNGYTNLFITSQYEVPEIGEDGKMILGGKSRHRKIKKRKSANKTRRR